MGSESEPRTSVPSSGDGPIACRRLEFFFGMDRVVDHAQSSEALMGSRDVQSRFEMLKELISGDS